MAKTVEAVQDQDTQDFLACGGRVIDRQVQDEPKELTRGEMLALARRHTMRRAMMTHAGFEYGPSSEYTAIDPEVRAQLEAEVIEDAVRAHKREVESGFWFTGKPGRRKGWKSERYGS